jgi:hypothetical protein
MEIMYTFSKNVLSSRENELGLSESTKKLKSVTSCCTDVYEV